MDRVVKLDQTLKVRNAETAGSVENVRLIGAKQADYALVQSNVAAMAAAGEGPFAQGGAVTSLRALGSLFPEPVHIVVPAASGIRTVEDLRGKRVALGAPDSGPGLTPWRSSPSTGSRRRISGRPGAKALRPRPVVSGPAASTPSSRRSGLPRGSSSAWPPVTPSVWYRWTSARSSDSSRNTRVSSAS